MRLGMAGRGTQKPVLKNHFSVEGLSRISEIGGVSNPIPGDLSRPFEKPPARAAFVVSGGLGWSKAWWDAPNLVGPQIVAYLPN
jgi:hypothetical protein